MMKQYSVLNIKNTIPVLLLLSVSQILFSLSSIGTDLLKIKLDQLDYPVSESSESERQLFEYFRELAETEGLRVSEQPVRNGGYTTFSSNLLAERQGKGQAHIILSASLNPSSREEAAGLQVLADSMTGTARRNTGASYTFLLSGAGGSAPYREKNAGLQHFLRNSNLNSSPAYVLFLEGEGQNSGKISAVSRFGNHYAPGQYLQALMKAAGVSGTPIRYSLHKQIQERILADSTYDYYGTWLESDIPVLCLKVPPSANLSDLLIQMPRFLPRELTRQNWDRNYLFIEGLNIFLNELKIIQIILLFLSLLVFILSFRNRHFIRHFLMIRHKFWSIPLIYFQAFYLLYTSSLLLERLYGPGAAVSSSFTAYALLLKILITLVLYRLVFSLLNNINLSRSTHFYSYVSLFSFTASFIYILVKNLPLALLLIPVMICFILFTLHDGYYFNLIVFLAGSVWLPVLILYIVRTDSIFLLQNILSERIRGNLILTIIVIPYLFQMNYLYLRQHHSENRKLLLRRNAISLLTTAVTVIAVLLPFYISPSQAYTEKPVPQIRNRTLTEKTEAIEVQRTVSSFMNFHDELWEIPLPEGYDYLEIDIRGIGFLDLQGMNYPYRWEDGHIILTMGPGAPSPLSLELQYRVSENSPEALLTYVKNRETRVESELITDPQL